VGGRRLCAVFFKAIFQIVPLNAELGRNLTKVCLLRSGYVNMISAYQTHKLSVGLFSCLLGLAFIPALEIARQLRQQHVSLLLIETGYSRKEALCLRPFQDRDGLALPGNENLPIFARPIGKAIKMSLHWIVTHIQRLPPRLPRGTWLVVSELEYSTPCDLEGK
jgi:hypothetical protein